MWVYVIRGTPAGSGDCIFKNEHHMCPSHAVRSAATCAVCCALLALNVLLCCSAARAARAAPYDNSVLPGHPFSATLPPASAESTLTEDRLLI